MSDAHDVLWVEKYRPTTIDQCILPARLKDVFKGYIAKGELEQHLLLAGPSGLGKTTIARAIANELNASLLVINASADGNIDTLRNEIKNFASAGSVLGNKQKIVLLDEADYSNAQSFQPALRAFMEEFASSCRFIFTANMKNKIMPAIHSRCAVIDFSVLKDEALDLQCEFFRRLEEILRAENVEYDKKVVASVLHKHFPDFRRTLNELQRYAAKGCVDAGILVQREGAIEQLITLMKDKDWKNMRQWIAQNVDLGQEYVIRQLYNRLYDFLEPKSIPAAVMILGQYQYWAAFVADPEINLVACCTEIMSECRFA